MRNAHHFTTRRSVVRDWNSAQSMTPEQHFRVRARQWFYFHP